jgi:hypothetical protein
MEVSDLEAEVAPRLSISDTFEAGVGVEMHSLAVASHPYTPIIKSLPVKSSIWTATLIGAIGDVSRFPTSR